MTAAPIPASAYEGFRPGRLWSIWEIMEELKVGQIIKLVHSLVSSTSHGTDDRAPIADHWRSSITDTLKELLPLVENLGLDVSVQYIRDSLFALKAGPRANETGAMARAANMITNTIEIQLRSRMFFTLSPEVAQLFREQRLFGPSEAARFSEASWEMEEAAKCLALGRSTASAFHSIRSLEAGIRALSRCLAIPDPTKASERNWGKMLGSLKDGIDAKWPTNTHRLNGDGEFFDNAYAALAAMQNPWRNATMHLDQKYTEEEARHIFNAVKGFIGRVANRMDENGGPKA